MKQWEYQVTVHQLPESPVASREGAIECDQKGQCFFNCPGREDIQWLEGLFREKGGQGWELIQSGYHEGGLLCIWKKEIEREKKI